VTFNTTTAGILTLAGTNILDHEVHQTYSSSESVTGGVESQHNLSVAQPHHSEKINARKHMLASTLLSAKPKRLSHKKKSALCCERCEHFGVAW
jgi:hypothetical protein